MNTVYLFIGCTLLVTVCWLFFEDFLSPTSIICEVFAISSFFAIFSAQKRNIDISIETVLFIIAQLVIGIIVAMIFKLGHHKKPTINIKDVSILFINKSMYQMLLIIIVILTLIYSIFYLRAIMASSGRAFLKMLASFRQESVTEGVTGIPTIVQYFSKVIYAFAYFSVYVYIHDSLVIKRAKLKEKTSKIYLISVGLLIITALLTGARAELIYFVVFIFTVHALIKNKLYGHNFSIKNLIKFSALGFGALFGFYMTSHLIGRGADSFMDSISGYFGGPIIAFDRYFANLNNNYSLFNVWGKETFYSVVHMLYKLGFIDQNVGPVHLDYVYINGTIFTNVYTAFRFYITDFGIYGAFFIHSICIWFYEQFYYKCNCKVRQLGYVNKSILIYGLISYGLSLYFYSNYFYALIISLHTLIQIICICLFIKVTKRTSKRGIYHNEVNCKKLQL